MFAELLDEVTGADDAALAATTGGT
jgi:hypothetical protein